MYYKQIQIYQINPSKAVCDADYLGKNQGVPEAYFHKYASKEDKSIAKTMTGTKAIFAWLGPIKVVERVFSIKGCCYLILAHVPKVGSGLAINCQSCASLGSKILFTSFIFNI